MVVCITNYGAKIQQILVPDRHGLLGDVVLGYDSLDAVLGGAPSVGAFIGRYAGRIENATFELGGMRYRLGANDGPHCLHGGIKGSRWRVFDAVQTSPSSVEMRCVFADGEEGFPGTLALRLTYSLLGPHTLVLDYVALALDKPTVASFTTHAFFNLDGASGGSVLGHEVLISSSQYLPCTQDLVATGEMLPVEGTPFDFRQGTALASRVPEILPGYDDCYIVDRSGQLHSTADPAFCARVTSATSGRVMQVWSTEPALQFYTGLRPGQALVGGLGKGGERYFQQNGLCLEPQGYPNAPNRAHFPSAQYLPGLPRHGQTLYEFSVM
ncbi:MAG: galactose mutarotase [Polaromonas sp.]|nr:MAG: galactose mutarotase [Polaromonas sp.]